MKNILRKISIEKLSLGYKFEKEKDVVSLIFIDYFMILLFSVIIIMLHLGKEELYPVTYRYHSIILLGIIDLILIRKGIIFLAKILIITIIPFLLLILPPLAGLFDNEFYFWFPYIPIALSLIPQFILKPVRDRLILITILTIYFFIGWFIDDFMIFMSKGVEEIVPLVQRHSFYYNLIPAFIFAFVNLALGLLFLQNSRYEDIMKKQQNDLLQSEKMASLGILTAGIAHEINNPLNFISGSLNALKTLQQECLESGLNPTEDKKAIYTQIQEVMKLSFEGVHRVSEIVKSLSSYSHMSNDQKKPTRVQEIIESVLVIIRSKIPENVEIIKNYKNIPDVPCSEEKIHQVFLNIIDNALDAITDKAPGSKEMINIRIDTKETDHRRFALIRFENSGPPIPNPAIRKIFDPFYTTKEPGKGIGLGLSISYNIIKEHNGMLDAKNENGLVVFEVLLPVTDG